MTKPAHSGILRRLWTVLARALERGVLGRSSHESIKRLTGSDEYWDQVIAAQLGWPQKQPPQLDPHRSGSSAFNGETAAEPGLRDPAGLGQSPAKAYGPEPVLPGPKIL